MRNLKRALSLTLASVMLLGMMVVGTSAAAGYDDVKDTDNVEAIEVLQEIEVMVGDERGFGPDRPVNRAEMAVVMGKLLNLDYNYYESACPFTDVSGNYAWARGWVGAAYANKILSGRSATIFDPGATVTAVEAASMMMRALGYFQYAEDVADGFVLSTVRQGTDIGIFNGVGSDGNTAMTRNQVAQMALNALRSEMVTFTGTPGVDVNGVKVGYRAEYSPRTGTEAKYNSIASLTTTLGRDESRYYIQLGEQLYDGDLKLYDRDLDAFDRPARTWEYKGEQIGTYVKNELLRKAYSVKVTGKDLYDLLTKNTIDTYTFVISVDGVDTTDTNARTLLDTAWFDTSYMTRTYTDGVGETEKGVTTEVYVDTRNEVVYISIINTYLAIADDDYDEKDDELDLTVYSIDDKNGSVRNPIYVKVNDNKDTTTDATEPMTVSGEDFDIKDVKDEDKFLVNVAQGEIQTMWAPEILSEVIIDAFKLNSYVSTGGEQYDHDDTARYDVEVLQNWDVTNLKETTYNVILDQYGYLIGLERNSDPDQYVFLTGIDSGASNLYATRADANVIHMDGTMATVKVDLTKSRNNLSGDQRLLVNFTGNRSQVNRWCKYSVSDDGVYTLKMVPLATTTNVRPATAPKVAQFAQNVDFYDDHLNSGANNEKEINEKRVSLIAWDPDFTGTGTTMDNNEVYVYGNDDTVYINVTLDKVDVDDTTGGFKRMIVDDVDSVTTGVKNVNLVMKELGSDKDGYLNPAAEIYSLYNDKGIVIAAVTMGEDNGTATNYAYITGNIDREEYGHKTSGSRVTEGKWTWYRDAIVDGEKTRLTETGDNLDVLNNMVIGEWYEIRYTTDGDVRRAKLVGGSDLPYGDNKDTKVYTSGKYVQCAQNVESAINNGNNTVLLHDITTVDQLRFENGTLYTKTDDTKGFHVGTDVKVVVVNANKNGTKWIDSVTDGYTSYDGVKKAITAMNSRGTAPTSPATTTTLGRGVATRWIELSAIMTNGFASVIVINDKSPDLGGSTVVTPGDNGKITTRPTASSAMNGSVLEVYVPLIDVTNSDRTNNANAQVTSELAKAGYLSLSSVTLASESGTRSPSTTGTAFARSGDGVVPYVVYTQDFRTVTKDSSVIEYVPYGTNAKTTISEITGTYAGYIKTNKTAGGIYADTSTTADKVTYAAYANTATTIEATVKSPVVIATGYVAVADSGAKDVTTVTACATGSHSTTGAIAVNLTDREDRDGDGTKADDWYFKGSDGFTVTYTKAATAGYGAHKFTLTVTGNASTPTVVTEVKNYNADTYNAAVSETITVKGSFKSGEKITTIAAALTDPPAATPITWNGSDATNVTLTANGITVSDVTLSSNAATATVGDKVTVSFKITGSATKATKITMAAVTGANYEANSGRFSDNAYENGFSVNSDKELYLPTAKDLDETITWTFTTKTGGTQIGLKVADQ